MNDFEYAFAFIMKWEVGNKPDGGYTNDPDDPGGETKYGISKRSYPDLDIKRLTYEKAKTIYHVDYWLKMKCDLMPPPIALIVFDAAVNQGTGAAPKMIQRSLMCAPDGIIGPNTMKALVASPREQLLEEFAARRARRYAAASRVGKYGLGWFRRLMDAVVDSTNLMKRT